MVNLLIDLQTELGVSYLFVSHDLSVVRHIAHRVGVMYLGELVEYAPTQDLFHRPLHPYTRRLIAAVPTMDIAEEGGSVLDVSANEDEVPSPVDPPSGCRYRTRCQWAQAICAERVPDMKVLPGARRVACHFVEADAAGQISAPGA